MCNYGYSSLTAPDIMASFVEQGLKSAILDTSTNLLVSPSGSLLDDWEVPEATRRKILRLVSRAPWRQFLFETQANFVSDHALTDTQALLSHRPMKIVLGLESFREDVRRLCINKDLPQSLFLEAVERIHRHGIETSINVIIGAPFLELRQQIEDVLHTILELSRLGVTEIFLFPVNVKIGTLVQWLWENGLYNPPSLWALVYIILNTPGSARRLISFAWHKEYYAEVSDVTKKVLQRPVFTNTEKAEIHNLSEMLERYLQTRDPQELSAAARTSAGFQSWLETLNAPSASMDCRSILVRMTGEVLGQSWLNANGSEVDRFATELTSLRIASQPQ